MMSRKAQQENLLLAVDALKAAAESLATIDTDPPKMPAHGADREIEAAKYDARGMIRVLWANGMRPDRAIAETLNLMGYRTEMGRVWNYQTVGNVINGKSPDPEKRKKAGRKPAQP